MRPKSHFYRFEKNLLLLKLLFIFYFVLSFFLSLVRIVFNFKQNKRSDYVNIFLVEATHAYKTMYISWLNLRDHYPSSASSLKK